MSSPRPLQLSNQCCHNPIYFRITEILTKVIKDLQTVLNLSIQDSENLKNHIYSQLGEPPNFTMGHVTFPCFLLAKQFKQSPQKIAQELTKNITQELTPQREILSAQNQGPYVNFYLETSFMCSEVISPILSGDYFNTQLIETSPKIMVEYSQPNTHKVLHVGHMRNLCLGNSLIKILRYTGHEVISATYPGDVGTHVAKCLWYMNKKKLTPPEHNKGEWLGKIYTLANHLLEDERNTPKEEQNRKELTDILKQLETQKGEYFDLWKESRQWSIDLMNKAYSWADVSFDRWFFESEVDAPSLKYANELYQKGVLTKDQGAIGMNLEDEKLGFCLLIKRDGNGLYATKDVSLAKVKFEEFGIEKNIYIVDNRQSFHFKQVFKVLEKIGFSQAKDCYHLPYDVVELPDGAMSSRKGNIIPLMELIEKMENEIIEKHLHKYNEIWSPEEIQQRARELANGAIKYGMVRVDNNRKIVFDYSEWLKLDGETGPYLQYVYARIVSLCQKQNYDVLSKNEKDVNWNKLTHPIEIELVLRLMNFNQVALNCSQQLKTLHLTGYLFELGKAFNHFYSQCPIGKLEDEELKHARLHLSQAVAEVMKKGLELIGIVAPEKM